MDLTAQNLHLLKTNHWLKDSKNVVCVRLDGPSWQNASASEDMPVSKTEQMRPWTVEEVVSFFEDRDCSGPATVLRQNGVNGSDLLAWEGWQQVYDDLRMTKFASQKIIALRHTFLSD